MNSPVRMVSGVKPGGDIKNIKWIEGQLLFLVDEGKIYLDYQEGEEKRRRLFYSDATQLQHKLTIGDKVYDGTEDVTIETFGGDWYDPDKDNLKGYDGDYDYIIMN